MRKVRSDPLFWGIFKYKVPVELSVAGVYEFKVSPSTTGYTYILDSFTSNEMLLTFVLKICASYEIVVEVSGNQKLVPY